MATTTFVDGQTVIPAAWLNDVNTIAYDPQLITLAGITTQQATDLAAVSAFMGTALNDADQATALTTLGAPLNSTLTKSTTYTVVAADRGKFINCTGSFTLGITSATTLGDGFVFAITNSGGGPVVIDPAGTQLIDGFTTMTLDEKESVFILCTGTEFKTVGRSKFRASYVSADQIITAGGLLTLTHGLSTVPKVLQLRLKCVTAEAGFDVDDIIESTHATAHVVYSTPSVINIRFRSVADYSVPHKTTGVLTTLTNANWKLVVYAWV